MMKLLGSWKAHTYEGCWKLERVWKKIANLNVILWDWILKCWNKVLKWKILDYTGNVCIHEYVMLIILTIQKWGVAVDYAIWFVDSLIFIESSFDNEANLVAHLPKSCRWDLRVLHRAEGVACYHSLSFH